MRDPFCRETEGIAENPSRNSPQYRIGDYARYMGVTPDFLKHYEQFRLVSSETRENGYRYYPFGQSSKLLECMRLRSFGIPLRDMDEMLSSDDTDTVMDKLDARVQALERQILFEQAVIDDHRSMRAWFKQMDGKEEDWFVAQGEEMLFLPHTSQRNFLKDPRIYEILGDWLALMPMVKSCMCLPFPDGSMPPLREYAWGLLVPASVAKAFDLPVNDAVVRLPPRKTFYFHFSGKSWPQLSPPNLPQSSIYKKMSQLGLTPTGDIYMTMYMYTRISTDSLRYGYYAAPLE